MIKDKVLIITNLYPLPWQPTRATFNYQQFGYLEERVDVYYLIPIAFLDWWKHRKEISPLKSNINYVPYIYIPKFGRRYYAKLMQWSICLMANSWIKKIAPTKILASWAYPDAVAAVEIAKKHKAEFYLKVHGSDINMHATFPERAKQITAMANHAKGILSVSQDLVNKMVAMDIKKEKIKVIYNGVNLEKFKPYTTNTDSPYIIYIGNLKHEKGVIELLNAFIQLHSNYPQFTLKYVGGGPMLGKLKNMVRQHQLENKVIFEGIIPHDQLPKLIGQATLLALPSYNEGVPNVVLEAMACATPVVVTNVGGIPEVVTVETGIIAKEITAESIAKCLQQALDKSWDHIAIRKHAENFNWEKNTKELASLLTLKEH